MAILCERLAERFCITLPGIGELGRIKSRLHSVFYEFHLNSRRYPAKTTLQRYPSSSMLFPHYTVLQIDKRAVLTDGSAHKGNTEEEKKGHVVLKFKNDVNSRVRPRSPFIHVILTLKSQSQEIVKR